MSSKYPAACGGVLYYPGLAELPAGSQGKRIGLSCDFGYTMDDAFHQG